MFGIIKLNKPCGASIYHSYPWQELWAVGVGAEVTKGILYEARFHLFPPGRFTVPEIAIRVWRV